MPSTTQSHHSNKRPFPLSSMLTLARWRLKETWFLLLITTVGMIAAIIIICTVPLFSNVMTTAGLRNTLRETPDNSEIEFNSGTLGISTPLINNVHQQFNDLIQQNMGPLASHIKTSQFSIISSDFSFATPSKEQRSLIMHGSDLKQALPYLSHLQGRVAQPAQPGSDLEIMLTPDTAKQLGLKLGSSIQLTLTYYTKKPSDNDTPPQRTLPLTAHVVGLFNIAPTQASYWHGEDFQPVRFTQEKLTTYTYTFLLPNDSLLALFNRASTTSRTDAIFSYTYDYSLQWYYRLDSKHLAINDLDNLINQLAQLQNAENAQYGDLQGNAQNAALGFPYLTRVALSSSLFSNPDTPSSLERLRSRISIAQIPIMILTIQIILLILFFVSLVTTLLVERQAEAIAVLRSRGASSGQIFGAQLIQCIVLGIIAILLGLPLSLLTVTTLSQHILPASQQDALNIITSDPLSILQTFSMYALGIIIVVLITMSISLFTASRMDVLAIRRSSARNNKRPLWQRLNLDVVAGIIALVGAGMSFYVSSIGSVIQDDAKTLIATPLSIIAPFFIIIGCMFLFLRIFPLLLRLAAYFVARGRGAVSMLALAQIARSPRQYIRMTMLLAIATAFAIFSLVYTATQSQHVQDLSIYQVGADFSGDYPTPAKSIDSKNLTNQYRSIPGTIAASSGFVTRGSAEKTSIPIEVRAVDTESFSNAVIWPSREEQQTATPLLAKIIAERNFAEKNNIQPAIVDTITAQNSLLHVGSLFTVKVEGLNITSLQCAIIGIVPSIPTINNHISTNKNLTIGGVLIDYPTYVTNYQREMKKLKQSYLIPDVPTLNHVWLHTRDDDMSLASVRTALRKPSLRLQNLADRREILTALNTDPLYRVLTGVLGIGTVTTLLLALVGDLLASWLSARTRQTNFAVLRAIGTTPQEVARLLTWEQAIVYITGLLLGIAFGTLISLMVIPSLTITDLNTNGSGGDQFYALQNALPTHIVVPSSLIIGLAILIGIYALALITMVRVVSRPALNQMIRLNED